MNILPANNSNSFKGTLIINNLKRNKNITISTTKEMDKLITDKFQQTICNNELIFDSPQKYLNKIKGYIKTLSQITESKFGRLNYPNVDEMAVMFNSSKTISELNVPDFFSITHISK